MKNIYIAFDDSTTNPTYALAGSAFFVGADGDTAEGNPCASPDATWLPVLPENSDELKAWAEMMGWTLETVDGKLVVHTDIPAR